MRKSLFIALIAVLAIGSFAAFAENEQAPAVKSAAPAASAATAASPATAAVASPPADETTIVRGGNVIVLPHRGACGTRRETASVEINFMYGEDNIANLSKEIDDKVADVKSEAAKAGATTADMTEMNYNVNSGRNFGYNPNMDMNAKYHINGNMHFNIVPADKAAALLEALSGKTGYNVNLNYRMNSGFCPGMMQ